MTMNCWGMPASLGSLYKEERMQGIAEEIHKGAYDLYLLEELWMEPGKKKAAIWFTSLNLKVKSWTHDHLCPTLKLYA